MTQPLNGQWISFAECKESHTSGGYWLTALFNNSPSTPGSILGVLTGKVLAEDLLCRANGTKVTESDARLRQHCSVGASSSSRGGRGAFILTSW